MQCFANPWIDALLGVILLLHIFHAFPFDDFPKCILLCANLFWHSVLFVLMLLFSFPLEELLVLVLGSALLGLGLAYLAERGGVRHDL